MRIISNVELDFVAGGDDSFTAMTADDLEASYHPSAPDYSSLNNYQVAVAVQRVEATFPPANQMCPNGSNPYDISATMTTGKTTAGAEVANGNWKVTTGGEAGGRTWNFKCTDLK